MTTDERIQQAAKKYRNWDEGSKCGPTNYPALFSRSIR
jgi:hypothetical protein